MRPFTFIILLAAAGCQGNIGDVTGAGPTGRDGPNPDSALACDDPSAAALSSSPLRRLAGWELEATVADLFPTLERRSVAEALGPIPSDRSDERFSTQALRVSSTHVDGYVVAAKSLAERVAADPAALESMEPCLVTEPVAAACRDAFIESFGARAFRRPLRAEERADMVALYELAANETVPERVELTLRYALQAPAFLYRPELVEPAEPLDDYAVASRLSYLLWGSMPDAALFAAAAEGRLRDQASVEAQVDRMLGDPRARHGIGRFFDEWLGFEAIPTIDFSEDFLDGIDSVAARAAALRELEALVEHEVFDAESTVQELLATPNGFVDDPDLAAIYGIAPPADGAVVRLPESRKGLLSRAGLLFGVDEENHPILRGAFVLQRMLCYDLAPPDDLELPSIDSVDPGYAQPSRDRWDALTAGDGCTNCHGQINPIGFAAEAFDSAGRLRSHEVVEYGGEVHEFAVDTRTTFVLDGERVSVSSMAELSEAIARSEEAIDCFARKWLRFALGRHERTEGDACFARDLQDHLRGGGSVRSMIARFAAHPELREKRSGEER